MKALCAFVFVVPCFGRRARILYFAALRAYRLDCNKPLFFARFFVVPPARAQSVYLLCAQSLVCVRWIYQLVVSSLRVHIVVIIVSEAIERYRVSAELDPSLQIFLQSQHHG